MVEIRRILCPVDFSDTSRHALAHAVALGRWYEARITILYVIHPEVVLQPPLLFAEAPSRSEMAGTSPARVQEQLHAWLEPARAAGLQTDAIVDEGSAARHILGRAETLPADLIVMGTHGRGGFERLALGSVTEKVLRKATCPVMSVPPPAVAVGKLPYTRILCPVDFCESSLTALRFAFSIAEEADAHLTILHVIDWQPEEDRLFDRFDTPAFRKAVEQDARERLDALLTDDVRVWCKPETVVTYGKPYRQILATAQEGAADVIVMGVHGRNPIDLALFGSTTNQVVRRASCPVLTMTRRPAAEQ